MLGEYLVVRRLGEGGVGSIYLALQQPIGLPAAVKLLHGEASALATAERFRQEAAALARLSHPNIVRLLKYGLDGETSYLVMEYVEDGRTLAEEMARGLDRDAARRVLRQICHGLDAAHARGVVHRDIKPANVMLQSLRGERCFVRLVDFGLAKFVDEGHHTQLAAGTPVYMAPEQAHKADIGPWTDVYAVTVIACEMLLGRHPFPGTSARSIVLRKCDPAFDPVAALAAPIGPATAALLRGGLAPAPGDRFRDMSALAVALDAAFEEPAPSGDLTAGLTLTADLEVEPGSGSAPEVAQGRPRWPAAALGVLALVSVVGLWWAYAPGTGPGAAAPVTPAAVNAPLTSAAASLAQAGERPSATVDGGQAAARSTDASAPPPDAAVSTDAVAPLPDAASRRPARRVQEPAARPRPTAPARPRSEAAGTGAPATVKASSETAPRIEAARGAPEVTATPAIAPKAAEPTESELDRSGEAFWR